MVVEAALPDVFGGEGGNFINTFRDTKFELTDDGA